MFQINITILFSSLQDQLHLAHYIKLDFLVLDSFLLRTITDEREIKALFEIMEKHNELSRSTIFCSQRDPNS